MIKDHRRRRRAGGGGGNGYERRFLHSLSILLSLFTPRLLPSSAVSGRRSQVLMIKILNFFNWVSRNVKREREREGYWLKPTRKNGRMIDPPGFSRATSKKEGAGLWVKP